MTIPALSYPQVEALLADLHAIPPRGRVALMGRIKNLQRKGWPGGTNTGKGRPAAYETRALIDLLLAFEFIALRIPPDHVVELLRSLDWVAVSAYLARLGAKMADGLADGSKEMGTVLRTPSLLVCEPDGLASLRGDEIANELGTVWIADESEGELDDALIGRRFAAINLARVFLEAARYLQTEEGIPMRDFGRALVDWAEAGEWPHDVD